MRNILIATVLLLFSCDQFAQAQTVTSLSSRTGAVGDTVSIFGTGLTGATGVQFGGVASTSVTVISDGQVNATVPSGFSYGKLSIVFPALQLYSGFDFTIITSAASGLTITLNTLPLDTRLVYDPKANTTTLWAGPGGSSASFLPSLIQTSIDNSEPGSIDWTGRMIWPGQQNTTGYLAYASDSAGAFYVRMNSNFGLVESIRGVEGAQFLVQGVAAGDEFEWRLTYEAASFAEFYQEYRINGVACLDCRVSQGGPLGPAIPTPSAFYFGTDNNGQNGIPGTATYFSAVPYTSIPGNRGYEIVIMGDSITAGAQNGPTQQWKLTPSAIYKPSERWTRAGIYSLAVSGSQVGLQQTRWDASTLKGKASVKAVVILIGVNDIRSGSFTCATTITEIQGLVTDIHTSNSSAKILLAQIPPLKGSVTAGQWTDIQCINSAIASYTTSFTNVDLAVTSHYAALNDGTDNYKAWLSNGDKLHPNNPGRDVIAAAMRAGLVSVGVLPP